jgi:hypothetical protein
VLEWQWDGELGPDEYFDVRVWREGKPHYGIAWEEQTSHEIDPRSWPASTYYWAIAVIRGRKVEGQSVWEADLSPESEVWTFTCEGGGGDQTPPTPPPLPTPGAGVPSPIFSGIGLEPTQESPIPEVPSGPEELPVPEEPPAS